MYLISRPLALVQEGIFVGALIILFFGLLSPVPKYSETTNLMSFTPFVPPEGYIPPNYCPQPGSSNYTVPSNNIVSLSRFRIPRSVGLDEERTVPLVKRAEGDGGEHSLRAIWIGPLGSCSRDDDGRVWCTKPSISHPQFNLTNIRPNPQFYPSRMKHLVETRLYLGITIVHCITFTLFLVASLPWYFPSLLTNGKDVLQAIAITIAVFHFVTGFALFIANFFIPISGMGTYNSIDNFYLPAPCGTARPLMSGVLMRATQGNAYKMVWGAWVMTYPVGLISVSLRAAYPDSSEAKKALAEMEEKKRQKEVRKEARKEAKRREKEAAMKKDEENPASPTSTKISGDEDPEKCPALVLNL